MTEELKAGVHTSFRIDTEDEVPFEHADDLVVLCRLGRVELHDVIALTYIPTAAFQAHRVQIEHWLLNEEGRHYLPCEGSGHVHQIECTPAHGITLVELPSVLPRWWQPQEGSVHVDVDADQIQDRQEYQDRDQDDEPTGPASGSSHAPVVPTTVSQEY